MNTAKQIPNQKISSQLKGILFFALPISLQSMIQTSFSIIDMLMISKLGGDKIAGIGVVGKFVLVYTIVINAIATIAGIMISQFEGAKNKDEVNKSLNLNLSVSLMVSIIVTATSLVIPQYIMSLYTPDANVIAIGANYLTIISLSFIPIVVVTIFSTLLRCYGKVKILLVYGIIAALINTALNYLLIFGNAGFPCLEEKGAALASIISVFVQMILCLFSATRLFKAESRHYKFTFSFTNISFKKYLNMLIPVFFTDVLWSIGESVYTSIYGHIGTDSLAAMSAIGPYMNLTIAAFSGFSQAGAILVGKELGKENYEGAYHLGIKVMITALLSSCTLAIPLIFLRKPLLSIFEVSDQILAIAETLLLIFLLYLPVKVQNLVAGAGIIRSGGNTRIIMIIGFVCTWLIGIPLALISSHFTNSICVVYALFSCEELIRTIWGMMIYRKKKWMRTIEVTK